MGLFYYLSGGLEQNFERKRLGHSVVEIEANQVATSPDSRFFLRSLFVRLATYQCVCT